MIPHVELKEGKMLEMDGDREDELVKMTIIFLSSLWNKDKKFEFGDYINVKLYITLSGI